MKTKCAPRERRKGGKKKKEYEWEIREVFFNIAIFIYI
jgi:hypothetical protein